MLTVQTTRGQAGNGHSGIDEIGRAKQLFDSGAITADEFAPLEQRALT